MPSTVCLDLLCAYLVHAILVHQVVPQCVDAVEGEDGVSGVTMRDQLPNVDQLSMQHAAAGACAWTKAINILSRG